MNAKRSKFRFKYLAILILSIIPRVVFGQGGLQTINVDRYPPELQQTYQLFVNRCATCHDLASSINSDYVLPGYYESMVQAMQEMPDSGISASEGQKIYEFLVYDALKRRKRKVKQQLKSLPDKQKRIEIDELKKIKNKYTK